jgi:phosphoglycerate dehydrogenase-like enzyme
MRLAIIDDYQNAALASADWSALDGRVAIDVFADLAPSRDALIARLAPYDAILCMRERTRFDAAMLAALPRLRLLVTTGMRNAAIDLAAAAARGVTVCGTRAASAPAAEMAWALLLAAMRHLPDEAQGMRQGRPWQATIGRELAGRTLGVVGLGKLGAKIARYALAFDMTVLGLTRSDTPARCAALGVEPAADLDDLLRRSDVVSLHPTLTAQTRGMIGARELALLKPGAVLVNTARGPLVDEPALIAALNARPDLTAALDVFDVEPTPLDHPFRRLPNVVATPHLGYVTRETYAAWHRDAVEAVAAFLDGAPLRALAP